MPNEQTGLPLEFLEACDLADAVRGNISRLKFRLRDNLDTMADLAVVRETLEVNVKLLEKLENFIEACGDLKSLPVEGGRIDICSDHIAIYNDAREEVVYWNHEEWEEDGACAQVILGAMTMAVMHGVADLAKRIPPYIDEA